MALTCAASDAQYRKPAANAGEYAVDMPSVALDHASEPSEVTMEYTTPDAPKNTREPSAFSTGAMVTAASAV